MFHVKHRNMLGSFFISTTNVSRETSMLLSRSLKPQHVRHRYGQVAVLRYVDSHDSTLRSESALICMLVPAELACFVHASRFKTALKQVLGSRINLTHRIEHRRI